MNINTIILFFILITSGANGQSSIISIQDLKAVDSTQNISIIAVGKPEQFETSRVLNARNIWRPDYEDSQAPYSGMMAPRDSIADLLGQLGIQNSDQIIIYDYKGGCDAARFWWILKYYGHPNAKVLDVDITKLESVTEHDTSEYFTPTKYSFPELPDPSLFIDLSGVKKAGSGNAKILDVRTKEEYTGEMMKDGAFKKGHIPNALFLPWTEAIHSKGDKKLKSIEELKELYSDLDLSKNDEIIVYCHSGVRSAHTAFVLTEILGYTNVKNYDGSWIEYSYNKELPVETGGLGKEELPSMSLAPDVWILPMLIIFPLLFLVIIRRRKRKNS